MKYQIVIMDERGFILEYKDFTPVESAQVNHYVQTHLNTGMCKQIEIRKWDAELN